MKKRESEQDHEGRYEIMGSLGAGGFGKIYLVLDKKLSVKRVMKRMYIEEIENCDRIRQQFVSEIRIMRGLKHPAIPSITDAYESADGPVIIMEYVEGSTLEKWVKERELEEADFLQWAAQLCGIIDYLHHRNKPVIHKDVKPSNIIIDEEKKLHLIDFGIAQELESDLQTYNSLPQGTDSYAAPEQRLTDGRIDFRTDIYGFGKTLEFCLRHGSISGRSVISSRSFRVFLQKCIKEEPQERFRNIEEIKKAMDCLEGKRHGKAGSVIMGLSLILCLFLGSIYLLENTAHKKEALCFLNCAKEALNASEALAYYEKALCEDPKLTEIYESLTKTYLTYDSYSENTFSVLLNILEESRALEKLEKKNSAAYSGFCYAVGVSYFFYMGGVRGKKEAAVWFERALQFKKEGLDALKKKRADCYREIGRYYKAFLTHDRYSSEEAPAPSYKEFIKILHRLNTSVGKEESRMISNLIAFEIAMEIHEYAEFFLEDGVLPEELKQELVAAEKRYDSKDSPEKKRENENTFAEILADARTRIRIWEVNHETRSVVRRGATL